MNEPQAYSDVEYVFEPHSSVLPDLREYVTALWERRTFMVALATADLRSLRSKTSIGTLWAVLDPLFQGAIYFFLFTVIRGGGSSSSSSASNARGANFLPILLGGFFLFGLTTAALSEGGGSIKRAKGLMLNSAFPRAMLPITAVYKSVRKFVPAACVFAVLFPLLGGKLGPGLFVLPLLFVIQITMNVGIALLISTFVVLFPDGQNFMNYVNRVLFFATPIVYPVSLLPPGARLLVGWQPLFAMFASYQAVFSGGIPSVFLVLQATFWAIALLAIGGNLFLRHEREFALHL